MTRGPRKGSHHTKISRPTERICADCGQPFWGRSTGRYCIECKDKRFR